MRVRVLRMKHTNLLYLTYLGKIKRVPQLATLKIYNLSIDSQSTNVLGKGCPSLQRCGYVIKTFWK